jgi:hypothetical protein
VGGGPRGRAGRRREASPQSSQNSRTRTSSLAPPSTRSHINKHNDFGDNTIATSKYTVVSFVPRSLLEQCVARSACRREAR